MSAHNEEIDGLIVLKADADAAGQRLDQWLAARLGPDLSRSRIQALVKQGAVSLVGAPVTEPKRKLTEGDEIAIVLPEAEPAEPLAKTSRWISCSRMTS
jgi:23S rRNA pseudouridine1911/1915/1917 synthase